MEKQESEYMSESSLKVILTLIGLFLGLLLISWIVALVEAEEYKVCEFQYEDGTYHLYYSEDTESEIYDLFSYRYDYFMVRKGFFRLPVNEVKVLKDTPNATDIAIEQSIIKIEWEAGKKAREAAKKKELEDKLNKLRCD